MNETIYQLGMSSLRWLGGAGPLARGFDHFSKVWLRHRKVAAHLRHGRFDGVIDGGANVGEFAQIVRGALPKADLICVEPHPASAGILRKQGFHVVEAALWKKSDRIQLTQPTAASTSCTVMRELQTTGQAWEVDAVRLDSLPISGSRLFLKLDLQGAEFEALEGMGELWERCAGVLLEVSIGEGGTYEQLRKLLSERGFAESSTTNELEEMGRVIEADKLWLRHEPEDRTRDD